MVKKAEKITKRSPLLPVFGLLIAVGLGAIAYVLSNEFVLKMPQVRAVIGDSVPLARWAFTLIIWLMLLGIAYFLVAVLTGKDPESAQQYKLPTKQKDLPASQRRKTRR